LGEIHYGRKKVQPPRDTVRAFYARAEEQLQFAVVRFNAEQIDVVGEVMGAAIAEFGYTSYACAVLPDHVHLLIRKHRHRAEQMIENLQRSSRLRLSKNEVIPAHHPVWTQGGWRGFLDSQQRVRTVIRYIEDNPARGGLAAQHWPFVAPYDGWPFPNRPRCHHPAGHPLAV
jgi:REP-associated tyrosine transposase